MKPKEQKPDLTASIERYLGELKFPDTPAGMVRRGQVRQELYQFATWENRQKKAVKKS